MRKPLTAILLALLLAGAVWAETGGLFVLNAEEGGASPYSFGYVYVGTGNTFTISSAVAAHGTSSYAQYLDSAAASRQCFGLKLYSAQTDVYARCYVYFPTGFSLTGWDEYPIISITASDDTSLARVSAMAAGGGAFPVYLHLTGLGSIDEGPSFAWAPDTWYCVEVRWLQNATVGGAQVWIDQVSKASNFTKDTSSKAAARLEIGTSSASTVIVNADTTVYTDDIKADTFPVGAYPASTYTAATVQYSDVAAAMAMADEGDTVTIPAGTETWSSTLTVTKGITIQGAGSTATVITASAPETSLVNVEPGSNKAVRVTGIGFIGGSYQVSIGGSTNGSYVLDKIRVDHCSFTNGSNNIGTYGWLEGLIDHNYFLNCNRAILIVGDNTTSWTKPIEAGTSHALFIEDNTFKQTNAGGGGLNENVYHWEGARTVIRYNDFDGSEYTSYDFVPFDSHGNQGYGTSGVSRGQPILEVYNNTFRYHHSYRVCYIRGGSVLFHDNAFTYVTSSTEIVLSEEESWQTAFFSPLRASWPAQDQVNNSFFWGNTRNGAAITAVGLNHANDAAFIQLDRDYFMHAPQATGGSESYTGARKGGATTYPTEADDGDTTFSSAGANAFFPYAPYTYPHPLQAGATTYNVAYDGNGHDGGTEPTDTGAYEAGVTVTTKYNSGALVKTNYVFNGWNTAANGSGTARAPGGTWAMGAGDVTLYAQWTVPVIGGGQAAAYMIAMGLLGPLLAVGLWPAVLIYRQYREVHDENRAIIEAMYDYDEAISTVVAEATEGLEADFDSRLGLPGPEGPEDKRG